MLQGIPNSIRQVIISTAIFQESDGPSLSFSLIGWIWFIPNGRFCLTVKPDGLRVLRSASTQALSGGVCALE
jgi:hypothetical protein